MKGFLQAKRVPKSKPLNKTQLSVASTTLPDSSLCDNSAPRHPLHLSTMPNSPISLRICAKLLATPNFVRLNRRRNTTEGAQGKQKAGEVEARLRVGPKIILRRPQKKFHPVTEVPSPHADQTRLRGEQDWQGEKRPNSTNPPLTRCIFSLIHRRNSPHPEEEAGDAPDPG